MYEQRNDYTKEEGQGKRDIKRELWLSYRISEGAALARCVATRSMWLVPSVADVNVDSIA